MNRRGVTLAELLVAIPLLAVVGTLSTLVFQTVFEETPKTHRAVAALAAWPDALRRMQADVDRAEAVLPRAGDLDAGEHRLLLRLPDRLVRFEVRGGQLLRVETPAEPGRPPVETAWPLPGVRLRFGVLQDDGRPYAVEVRSAVEVTLKGRPVERLTNSSVLFLHSLPARRLHP